MIPAPFAENKGPGHCLKEKKKIGVTVTFNCQPAAFGLLAPCDAALVETFVRLGGVRNGHCAGGAAADRAAFSVEVEHVVRRVQLRSAAQGHSSPVGHWEGGALQNHTPICNTTIPPN